MSVPVEVYPGYTQSDLDAAYDQRVWADDMPGSLSRWAAEGASARALLDYRDGLAYGPGASERFDLFPGAGAGPRPIHIHVHGGAWRSLARRDASFLAPVMVAAGVTLIIPDFDLLPSVRMPTMVDQLTRLMLHVNANAAALGGDPGAITLSGHSSGAHLAAVLATQSATQGIAAAVVLISGAYDLEPVLLSARREYVVLDPDEARALSPIHHVGCLSAPTLIAVGERESPAFRSQATVFVASAKASGSDVTFIDVADTDHFGILQRFATPEDEFGKRALAFLVRRGSP